ncbi:CubicO group peptidase (beta-lactamase class C family) [Rhizobium sp. BK312]|uniref:serine hydrolase domain-containing protein n=1 Tax=Rhizobium sp. BK312 TaxID=2587080 RepID=UPI000DD58CE3|nr:serine hydrolase [Rhizobium sp. BK312]MBB3427949.1 CubicO group peptidase (beta-lactamase class C family) [Rhizobium sp. BK312]
MRFVAVAILICLSVVQALAENSTIPRSAHRYILAHGESLGAIAIDCTGKGSKCSISQFMKDARVCALLVIKKGRIRLERYAEDPTYCKDDGAAPNGPGKLYGIASVTKSITSTLLGAAMAERYHARSATDFASVLAHPVKTFVPAFARDPASAYADVPLDRVLRMRSAVRWSEWGWHGYFSDNARLLSEVRQKGTQSVEDFARKYRVRVSSAQSPFAYSALDAAVAALTAERVAGRKLPVLAYQRLWNPIGATSVSKWGVDKTGTALGNCCFRATVGDLGRFGMFVLNKGKAPDGTRIIPSAWFDLATKRVNGADDAIPQESPSQNASCPMDYRFFWWLRQKSSDFTAIGTDGQFIHIYPESDIVIVQISDWQGWKDGDRRECESFRAHDSFVDALGR